MSKTWREACAPIVFKIIQENKDKEYPEIRKALREAYPFGQKKYWPYKVWLDEINRQLIKFGLIEAKDKKQKSKKTYTPEEPQIDLFNFQ